MFKPIFLQYNPEEKEQELVKLFEEKTGKTLYPAQDERLLISLIEYKATLLVNLFNEAARLSLTQYSRGEILDYIGEMFGTKRLQGEYATDTIKITLNTTFSSDLTIPKGLEVLSKDEKYSFKTVEDCKILAGETEGFAKIEAAEIGSEQNAYGIGDITILVKPVSYILAITNVNGASNGAGIETDEAYIKRILLAPESFTCAGSRQSYIYHALSANTKIIDASVESVIAPATIKIGDTTYTEENGKIITPDFTVDLNRKYGQFKFTLNNVEYEFSMPSDTTVNIYPLTDQDVTANEILQDVENLLNGESVNPMTDNVIALAPQKVDKTITLNIKLTDDADYNAAVSSINSTVEEYKTKIRNTLNAEIIPSQIISKIGAIEGVYSVDTGDLTQTRASVNEFFNITFEVEIS